MKRTNIPGLVIALIALFACLLLVLPAALSGNALFALPVIREKPIQAIVYHAGETYSFGPGQDAYDALVDACYEALEGQIGVTEIGWSDARFEQVRESGVAVELIYAEPVKLPGKRVDIADPKRLFFPLEVPGQAEDTLRSNEIVFRGGEMEYWGLPIHVDTLDPVRAAVEQIVADG